MKILHDRMTPYTSKYAAGALSDHDLILNPVISSEMNSIERISVILNIFVQNKAINMEELISSEQ